MNATPTNRRRLGRRLGALMIAATALLLIAPAPASAGHDSTCAYGACESPVEYKGKHRGRSGGYGPITCKAHRAYERGYRLGHRDGLDQGCRDGSYGRPFCDIPWRRLRKRGPAFAEGYFTGYADGYASAYERSRRSHRRSYGWSRWRRWW